MNIDNPADTTSKTNHWFNLLMIVVYAIIGLFLGNFVGLIAVLPFYGFDPMEALVQITNVNNPDSRLPLMIMQGLTALFAFILAPYWFLQKYKTSTLTKLFTTPSDFVLPAAIVVAITISFMFVNSIFIEWNQAVDFPEALDWFEQYAMEQEETLEKVTIFLTSFDNFWQFLIAFVVIAIIPAVGEELLFRGIIQNEFFNATKNIHLAIWGSAFFFAFFHLQFYGLVPRMLLGALFGYLYYWSGSLTYASIAHFVNNGFTLGMLYLHQRGLISFDIQETESTPLETVVIFFIIGGILTYIFVRYHQKKPTLLNE